MASHTRHIRLRGRPTSVSCSDPASACCAAGLGEATGCAHASAYSASERVPAARSSARNSSRLTQPASPPSLLRVSGLLTMAYRTGRLATIAHIFSWVDVPFSLSVLATVAIVQQSGAGGEVKMMKGMVCRNSGAAAA